MDIVEIINQVVDLLGKSLEYAPFLATIGGFSIAGQITKTIFTKKRAVRKSKLQWFWKTMRLTLPLHPICAGMMIGVLDTARGLSYYALAGLLSVFLFDLVERFTGYDIKLPGESVPPPEA